MAIATRRPAGFYATAAEVIQTLSRPFMPLSDINSEDPAQTSYGRISADAWLPAWDPATTWARSVDMKI